MMTIIEKLQQAGPGPWGSWKGQNGLSLGQRWALPSVTPEVLGLAHPLELSQERRGLLERDSFQPTEGETEAKRG